MNLALILHLQPVAGDDGAWQVGALVGAFGGFGPYLSAESFVTEAEAFDYIAYVTEGAIT